MHRISVVRPFLLSLSPDFSVKLGLAPWLHLPAFLVLSSTALAQEPATLEGAIVVRQGVGQTTRHVAAVPTVGGQITFYISRSLAVESDLSTGTAEINRGSGTIRASVRPLSVRGVWMPSPWGIVRGLIGIGVTRYFFAGSHPAFPDAEARTLTVGVQQDVRRARLRLDLDYLAFSGAAFDQIDGGAVRLSVGLKAPRSCCP